MTRQPRIGIVIVHFNSYEDTSRCLISLKNITYKNIEIIVVDNGSHDNSGAALKTNVPEVIFLRSEVNEGFTGGSNIGIVYALSHGCDHVLLLNNDTIVTASFLEPLVERLTSDPAIGSVSGKIYYHPSVKGGVDKIIWYAGAKQKWHMGFVHVGESQPDQGQYETSGPTVYTSGCLMLMRGDAIRKTGILSPEFFMYCEESDWCFRASEFGYQSWYEPRSVIYHNFRSAPRGRETPFYMYLQFRNAFILVQKHFHKIKRIQFWLTVPFQLANRSIMCLLKGNIAGLTAIFAGVRDYFRGFRGKQGLAERGFLK